MRALYILVASTLCGLAATSCSVDEGAPVDPVGAADAELKAQFPPVASMLSRRCGTIDCHGSKYRNFRPKHGAFCLETQHYPDSPNRPEFPTTRLNPGETYTQTTVHKFSVAK